MEPGSERLPYLVPDGTKNLRRIDLSTDVLSLAGQDRLVTVKINDQIMHIGTD